jgi:hypothetical protein
MSAPELEDMLEHDPRWYNRALAVFEAERLAEPLLEERQRREAAQRQVEAAEHQRAQKRENERMMARILSDDVPVPEPRRGPDGELYWPAVTE